MESFATAEGSSSSGQPQDNEKHQQLGMTMQSQTQPMMVPVPLKSCKSNTKIVAYVNIVISIIDIILSALVIYQIFTTILAIHDVQRIFDIEISKLETKRCLYSNDSDYLNFIDRHIELLKRQKNAISQPYDASLHLLNATIFISVLCIIARCLEIWLTIGLLIATAHVDLPVAMLNAKRWLVYAIFSMILCLVFGGMGVHARTVVSFTEVAGGSFISFVVRLIGSFVVYKFIQELKVQLPDIDGRTVP